MCSIWEVSLKQRENVQMLKLPAKLDFEYFTQFSNTKILNIFFLLYKNLFLINKYFDCNKFVR